METTTIITLVAIVLALIFDFTNGFNDSANLIAAVVSTRALSLKSALWLVSVSEFIGAVFLGTAVAKTVAGGIVNTADIIRHDSCWVIAAALVGAIVWNILSWRWGVPSSSGHALIGGLVGAFMMSRGPGIFLWNRLVVIGIIMAAAPLISFTVSYIVMSFVYSVGGWLSVRVNPIVKSLQIINSVAVAVAHGTNDAQKAMGIIVLSLAASGWIPAGAGMVVPRWVVYTCAVIITLGIFFGAQRILHTVGGKIYTMRPENGVSAQISSALVIYTAAFCGCIISTTETVSGAIAGSGAAYRFKKVRWNTLYDIFFAWVITMPVSALIAAGCVWMMRFCNAFF